ncbi:MAG: type II secretion system protein [Alphaproteobacteria bacterium]|nr:type II secretion system protein [Alphaproteobacteria bacterium]
MPHRNGRTRGFTLIELAIVLGVMGAIIAAVWTAASRATEAQKQNTAVEELQTVAQNIFAIMEGRTFSITGNITSSMISSQAIPSAFLDPSSPTTKAINPWAGALDVYEESPTVFRVSFYDVSYGGCLKVLLEGTACEAGHSGCPTKVWTDRAAYSQSPSATVGWAVMNASVAATLCGRNSYSGGNNSVEFDYSLQ